MSIAHRIQVEGVTILSDDWYVLARKRVVKYIYDANLGLWTY
ncbi:hypothetical protein [Ensifer adhaerens]|uniref:Uncharacterized protein n=1 Tax=Ensifer adhaerens TaxID=106592 RepID=A0ABY8HLB5_ENSAD|nr:hypothetical protein [Ensifer adhaerens]WFP92833.1 hypothetical protein P4B07_23985 [Ensifer adhaerens]